MKRRLISVMLTIVMLIMSLPIVATEANATATKITTNHELVARAQNVANNYKTLYVMGAWGGPLTESNKQRYINAHTYNQSATRKEMINAASSDTFAFDCVCFIKSLLWGWDGSLDSTNGGAIYTSNGVPDIGTESIIGVCTEVSTDFSNIEVGELLWMSGHVGIYIGDGLAVECTPSWKNCVQITNVKNIKSGNGHTWTKHGKLPYVEYITDSMVKQTYYSHVNLTISADSAHVKTLPCSEKSSAESKTIESATKGSTYTAIGLIENTYGNLWYKVIAKNGQTGYIYSGDVGSVEQVVSDVSITGVSKPEQITVGNSFGVRGVVSAKYQKLSKIYAWVKRTSDSTKLTGNEVTIDTYSYDLSNAAINDNVNFNILPVGEYTYYIGASIKTYYAKSNTEVSTKETTGILYQTQFTVVESAPTTYTISYNANGGSGAPSSQTKIHGQTLTLSSIKPTRSGYTFLGWSTSSTATSATYAAGDSFTVNANITLYAVWTKSPYSITYYTASGSVWKTASSSEEYTLVSDYPNVNGSYFSGWAYKSDAKYFDIRPTDTISVIRNIELYPLYVTHEEAISGNPVLIYDIEDFTEEGYTYSGELYEIEREIDSSYWTDWSSYSTTSVTASDTVEVRTTAMYRYYYYLCSSCGDHNPLSGNCGCGGTSNAFYYKWFTTPYSNSSYSTVSYATYKCSTTSLGDGQLWYFSTGNKNHTAIGTIDTDSNAVVITTGYSSRRFIQQVETKKYDVWAYVITPSECQHNYQSIVTDPTCTEQGYTTITCSICGDSYKDTYVNALGHDWGQWAAWEDGLERRDCNRCDHYETREVEASVVELEAPVIKTSSDYDTGNIKINWETVDGASKYYIYRKVGSSGSYKYLASTTRTSYTNSSTEPGTTYYYKVKAIGEDGITSEYSNVSYRTCDLPRPVVTLSSVYSSGKIKLSWKKIDGAEKYYVYRSTSENGEFKYLGSTGNTSYTNSSAVAGVTYYYKVKAVHEKSAANSALSYVKSRTCDLPRPVVKASNVASTGKIKLTWDAVSGAQKYYVYRATSEDGEYKYVTSTTGTSFTNTATTAGRTYYYRVKAIHANSAANSAKSTVVSRTCDLERPVISIGLSSTGKPRITWDAVDGALRYEVYRSTSKNGTYTYIAGTINTNLTNTGAEAGRTYYYKVKAVHTKSAANSALSYAKSITSK